MEISKTDLKMLLFLMDKACVIIKAKDPPPKEYNVARQLWLLRRKFEKKNKL